MAGEVLVTGATGFVGGAVVERAAGAGWRVRAAARRATLRAWQPGVTALNLGDLSHEVDWRKALEGVDAVVHCAARVHVMRESAADPLAAFRAVNVAATLNLARQAVAAGVGRFVFVSTIGVNGAETFDRPFSAADAPDPHSPYAASKHEAEAALRSLAIETGLELVIVRPPLVIGAGAPGNYARLMRWLQRGLPLPLASVRNRRSLVGCRNLADLIVTCLAHPDAPGQTFLVCDGEDLSTPELLRRTASALGRTARLLPMPPKVLRAAANLAGRGAMAQQLCGSLQVDDRPTRERLNWFPAIPLDVEIRLAAKHHAATYAPVP
jgi:nucleoside-diphosphate-sugar epimerase